MECVSLSLSVCLWPAPSAACEPHPLTYARRSLRPRLELTQTLFIILIKYLLILCHEFRSWTPFGFRGIFLRLFNIVFIEILKFNFKVFIFTVGGALAVDQNALEPHEVELRSVFFVCPVDEWKIFIYAISSVEFCVFVRANVCGGCMAASKQQNMHAFLVLQTTSNAKPSFIASLMNSFVTTLYSHMKYGVKRITVNQSCVQ